MEDCPKSNPVSWFEIYVQDMKRAQAFYEKVFDTKLEKIPAPDSGEDFQMLGFPGDMGVYGSNGALVHMKGVPSGGGGTLVYFACDDCSVEEKRVSDAGGKVDKSKFSIGQFGFVSLIVDPEGNMVGLHSMK